MHLEHDRVYAQSCVGRIKVCSNLKRESASIKMWGKNMTEKIDLQCYCMQNPGLTLLKEWDFAKNENIRPNEIVIGSHKKVWWKCPKGHSWAAEVRSRIRGTKCPYCTNRKVLSGFNDLATCCPEIAKQWHFKRNKGLTPDQVLFGSRSISVWWKCEKGHEWKKLISNRTRMGSGCPVCAGKKVQVGFNDLETRYPELSKQWDKEKNGKLRPSQVTVYSNRHVWWKCRREHSWKCSVAARTAEKSGCPVCAGKKVLVGFNDLETKRPELAKQWHPILNGDLTPQMVTRGSNKKVWWQCREGHVWQSEISSRAGKQRHGCPVCAGRVKGECELWISIQTAFREN